MIGQIFSAGLAAVIPLVILALIVFAIVALVTGRRDPDPSGSRPYTIYLVLIIFFSMFTALFALTAMASNIAKIPQGQGSGNGCIQTASGEICSASAGGTFGSSSSGSASGSTGPMGQFRRLFPSPQTARYDPAKQATASAIEAALVALVAIAVL